MTSVAPPTFVARRNSASFAKRPFAYYVWRRMKWALGNRQPLVAFLKVTDRCNLDCGYCPWHASSRDEDQLGTTAWRAVISGLFSEGVRLFVFEGGEPTIRHDLDELLGLVRSLGGHSVLVSNGTTDTWSFCADGYALSIDGPEEVHDAIRGAGVYKRVLENLENRGTQRTIAITVLSRDNFTTWPRLLAELNPKVDGFLFTVQYPYARAKNSELTALEQNQIRSRLLELKQTHTILNTRAELRGRKLRTPACKTVIAIDHQGNRCQPCFVGHVEPPRCDVCELGCYHFVAALHRFNLEAWFSTYRLFLGRV